MNPLSYSLVCAALLGMLRLGEKKIVGQRQKVEYFRAHGGEEETDSDNESQQKPVKRSKPKIEVNVVNFD